MDHYPPSVIARLLDKIDPQANGCWEWTARRHAQGYGYLFVNGRQRRAHRVAYEALLGEIPPGYELDHLCRNRGCVNPDHLEPVTHAENMRRSARAQQTHCKRGHAFDAVNTYIDGRGLRRCRTCARDWQRAKRSAA